MGLARTVCQVRSGDWGRLLQPGHVRDVDDDLDRWFVREILAHEAALVRYLRRVWRSQDDVLDLRQETYLRVYEAAAISRPRAPKSYMFTTARNLMADRVRRGRVVSIEAAGYLGASNVLIDEVSPERHTSAHEQLRRLATAFDALPPKCREVMWLRRVDGLSQKEVAKRLGVTAKTVEKHIARGMRLLADSLLGSGRRGGARNRTRGPEAGSKHER